MARLVAKPRSKNLHPHIVNVLASWLRQRSSRVVVGGMCSDVMMLSNMVFQGTVAGGPNAVESLLRGRTQSPKRISI
jgi:hypothetical protein